MDQKLISSKFLARMLYKNEEAHSLLFRLFPDTLFAKVKAGNPANKNFDWTEANWNEFFIKVIRKDSDLATELWNEETRSELTCKLLEEVHEFLRIKQVHFDTVNDAKC